MAVNEFTPANQFLELISEATSKNTAIPGSANPTAWVFNKGPYSIAVAFGSAGVTVSATTGTVIGPGQGMFLGVGANTYIAYINIDAPSTSNGSIYVSMGA